MRSRAMLKVVLAAAVMGGGFGAQAQTGAPAPLVYPIYASQPDAPFNDLAQGLLARAAERQHLLPVETIDITRPRLPPAAEAVKLAKERVRKLSFDSAVHPLNEAASAVVDTGGAGLSTDELSDLFLYRGMAIARADWKPERSASQVAQGRAYADYVRA